MNDDAGIDVLPLQLRRDVELLLEKHDSPALANQSAGRRSSTFGRGLLAKLRLWSV